MEGFSETGTTIILLLGSFGIAASLYIMVHEVVAPTPITVELISAYCVNNTAYFVIRNGGDSDLTRSAFVCTKINSSCSGDCVVDQNFPAGGAGYVKVYDCSTGTQKFTLSGTVNSLELAVFCK